MLVKNTFSRRSTFISTWSTFSFPFCKSSVPPIETKVTIVTRFRLKNTFSRRLTFISTWSTFSFPFFKFWAPLRPMTKETTVPVDSDDFLLLAESHYGTVKE
uniref:Uncharacterized protein n=1 Tax=Cacopsylla melanoneura TaxID=428564 RepID=A0A8D9F0G1_9HEMI